MFYHYEGKTIIAWFSYRRDYKNKKGENKVCYIHPRYIKVDGVYRSIKDENIGDNERIDMVIKKDGLVASNVWDEYGFLVTVKFRVEPHRAYGPSTVVNENEDDDAEADLSSDDEDDTPANVDVVVSQVSVLYNPDFLNPHVEIRKFREWGFIQALETSESFESLLRDRFIECSLHPYTEELDALIGCGDSFYGPFKTQYKDNKLTLSGRKEQGFLIGKYRREDVEPYYMPVSDAENTKQVTLLMDKSLQSLQAAQQVETIDWITDKELVDELTRMFKKTNTSTPKKIISSIAEFSNQLDVIDMDERRKERLENMLDRIQEQQTYLDGLITYIYENPQQLNTLIDFVVEHRFDIFENKNHDIARLKTRLLELQSEVRSLNETKKTLEEQAAHFQAECTNISKTKALLEEQFAARLAEFADQSKALTHVLDYRLLQDIVHAGNEPYYRKPERGLGGNAVSADQNQKAQDTGPRFNGLDGGALIDIALNFMKTVPREIEYNDMVNYLVCITQGFITTFAGEPGTGKTSLCSLLASSLGLGGRFVDISVERGWMSHKDFIGYYNPLTKSMEKSNNRVFDALLRLSGETGDPAPFLILLDEANLSPIEHYWAAFLRLCDFDSFSSRSLDLGGTESWIVPPQLRFLATVNFDHTTEELSPRFLDRSWIITLKSRDIADTLRSENHDLAPSEPDSKPLVSYATLRQAFGAVHDGETPPRDISDKWNAIQHIFRYYRLPIAMRNQKMVYDYCKTACQYMDTKKPETRLAPLDYAVSQKILPIINGRGEQYRRLLLSLQKECEPLPLCHEHIERMISAAKENMEYYQFFAK